LEPAPFTALQIDLFKRARRIIPDRLLAAIMRFEFLRLPSRPALSWPMLRAIRHKTLRVAAIQGSLFLWIGVERSGLPKSIQA
jgi:hypothetical protein